MKTTATISTSLHSRRWLALAVLCTAQFMTIMDTSIIGVALPAIQNDLGYSNNSLHWIFNAYVILFGGMLLLGGKLADIFGARRIFSTGFVILTAASLFAGLAWNPFVLNTARALQGLGSAFIAPASLSLLMMTFTNPEETGKAMGFWGAAAAAGGSAGVFLGGVLTQYISWNWVFYINIPIGILVLAFTSYTLPGGAAAKGKLNILGALLITIAQILLVSGIVHVGNYAWTDLRVAGSFAGAIGAMLLFIISQKRSAHPLIPGSMLRVPGLVRSNFIMGLLAAAWIPLWFYLNLYLQHSLKLSAFQSGLALLPMTILIMIMMVGVTGKLIGRQGPNRILVAGLAVLAVSLFLFFSVNANGSYLRDVLLPSLLAAAGMALAYIPATINSMSGVKPEETGIASGLVNTSYQVGSAVGLAIIVAIASSRQSALEVISSSEGEAVTGGIRFAFLAAGIVAAVATLLALYHKNQKMN